MKRLLKVLGCVVVFLLILGCTNPFGPSGAWFPPDVTVTEVAGDAWHRQVWDETAACVSKTIPLTGDKFEDVHWYSVNAESFWNGETYVLGAYSRTNQIFNIARLAHTYNSVSHEAMHAMTHLTEHTIDPFVRCMDPWRENPEQRPSEGTGE